MNSLTDMTTGLLGSIKADTLSQTDDLSWPLLALVIFMVTFCVAAIYAWRRGNDEVHQEIARLPLADDSAPPSFPRGPQEVM